MREIAFEIAFIAFLILANGLLAMSELAVVSARRVRLGQRAANGDRGAQAALELAARPDRFLSTVQIGITLVGILAGAFGGATIAEQLALRVAGVPGLAPYADAIGISMVVLAITFLTLVIGELVPKQIALNEPERIAGAVAPAMAVLARVSGPLVWLLSRSTGLVLRMVGVRPSQEAAVTREEVRLLIALGTEAGEFNRSQQGILDRVMRLSDQRASALMTPRTDVVWLDLDDPPEALYRVVATSPHTRFPLARGTLDEVVGIVHAKDLLAQVAAGEALDPARVAQPALFVPASLTAFDVLERWQSSGQSVALVIDEFGGLTGIVSSGDLAMAIVGALDKAEASEAHAVVQQADGSWLMDGDVTAAELRELLNLNDLPDQELFDTLAGFFMTLVGQVPSTGDAFEHGGYRFEVVEMDGRRVAKVLVSALTGRAASSSSGRAKVDK